MKSIQPATLILIVASLFGFSQAAWACEDEVEDLQEALNSRSFDGICSHLGELRRSKLGKENCEGLNAKLEEVEDKLDDDEIRDAAWKIGDFGSTLEMLAYSSEPLISVESYNKLISKKFSAAALCIERLLAVQSD